MLGYSNFVLSTYQTENAILENLNIYLTIGGAVLVFVVVYFITYLILKASYKSKEKDYNILRTLGITKKSMNGIVRTEILTITLICSFFVYALSSILGNLINVKFFKYYRGLPFGVFIVYIVLILLLSLNISMRFNKKLFNTSVNSVFKDKEK